MSVGAVVVSAVCGYLCGSVPFAWLVTHRRGIDLGRSGSGNFGATNVMRTAGAPAAALVLTLDILKGAAAVLMARVVSAGGEGAVAAGLAAVVGHVYSVWLKGAGGKGVATTAGAFGVLSPAAVGVAAVVFVAIVATTRLVSAGSLAAALALVLAVAWFSGQGPTLSGAAAAAALIVFRHRSNVRRLVAGTEHRVGERMVGR